MPNDQGTKEKQLAAVVWQIRRDFWLLKAVSDQSLRDLGLTATLRAMLEHIELSGPSTVPQIAAAKTVTRQSVQSAIDQLLGQGLVSAEPNPAHKRSPFIAMTPAGRRTYRKIQARDGALLARAARSMNVEELTAAAATLSRLQDVLRSMLEGEPDDT